MSSMAIKQTRGGKEKPSDTKDTSIPITWYGCIAKIKNPPRMQIVGLQHIYHHAIGLELAISP